MPYRRSQPADPSQARGLPRAPDEAAAPIGILGAGAIGCYVGGRLAAAGTRVVLVGRPAVATEVATHGLHLSDYRGWAATPAVSVATMPDALGGVRVVIVTVKSADTQSAADEVRPHLANDTIVVSLQNGVSNPGVLQRALPRARVVPAMVPFNVARPEPGRFHQATSGVLALADTPEMRELAKVLVRAGLPTKVYRDMGAVAWGKLLVNLNNAINALAGIPIRSMLAQRGYRRIMAACIREGLAALKAAGIRPRMPVALPASWVPRLLEAPNAVFRVAARPMLKVDPEARSSMWDDLARDRETEIEELNGEVVRLAAAVGTKAPVNQAIVKLVHAAEGNGSPGMTAEVLAAQVMPRVGVMA